MNLFPEGLGDDSAFTVNTSTPTTPGPYTPPQCVPCTVGGGLAATWQSAEDYLAKYEEPKQPEGLGQGTALPRGVRLLRSAPSGCRNWVVAYVYGLAAPHTIVSGKGFPYKALSEALASLPGSVHYFSYTNNRGTYVFAFERVNGAGVIKLCSDGVAMTPTPNARAAWTAVPTGRRAAGVGSIFSASEVSSGPYGQGNVALMAIDSTTARKIANWGPWQTATASGLYAQFPDLEEALNDGNVQPVLVGEFESGQGVYDSWLYFGLADPNNGAAQTPGEPPGVAIMRMMLLSSGSTVYQLLTAEAPAAGGTTTSGGGGIVVGGGANIIMVVSGATPASSYNTGTPVAPGLWYNNYQWIYVGTPPATLCPPGAVAGATDFGAWVLVAGATNQWTWYPGSVAQAEGYGIIPAPGGASYVVFSQSSQAASGNVTLAMPTSPPPWLTGATGQWVAAGPAYYVFVPTAATSNTWELILLGVLGIAIVGGVGYYALS
jgi:hypothetical protein